MLEKEYKYYEANKEALIKEFLGRFVLIQGEKILGDYSSEAEAYQDAIKKGLAVGTFLIQECTPDANLKETFHSRVVFNS